MKNLLALIAAFVFLGAGCSGGTATNIETDTAPNPTPTNQTPTPTNDTESSNIQALIQDFRYLPQTITAKKGDKIVFINKDVAPHTVTADGGAFTSGNLSQGASFILDTTSFTPGTYTYHCVIHPTMKGTLIVQ